jgi:transcriptional regulator with PAS, ATPase and Fis domain
LKDRQAGSEVIVVGACDDNVPAADVLKAGASIAADGMREKDGLTTLVERAIEQSRLRDENVALREELRGREQFGQIIGKSRVMCDLFDLIQSVASSDANILIQGEHGTGKEIIANVIHQLSQRSAGPFVKINCAALPKDLIESELFGHKRGAFTGASVDRPGLLGEANGGSLLLDEIGEMPPYLQTKLLRVLQEREYRPIGSDQVVRVDFRLICATNVDPEAALREGRLRSDLYFRINTIALKVPSLRERAEDIPLLCDHFVEKFSHRYQKHVRALTPSVYHLLIRNRWPGNVRELENVIERAVLVSADAEIGVEDLPDHIRHDYEPSSEFVVPPNRTLAEIEKMAILQTLQRTNWNKQEAAAILGLYRPTLYSKMRKHDIRDPRRGR